MNKCSQCAFESENGIIDGNDYYCNDSCRQLFNKSIKESRAASGRQIAPAPVCNSISDIINFEKSEKELIVNMTIEQIMNHINELNAKMEELRARKMIAHRHHNSLLALTENERGERYRKIGANSDLDAKRKIHNVIEKAIISYRKMGLDDKAILGLLLATTKKNEVELNKIILEVK